MKKSSGICRWSSTNYAMNENGDDYISWYLLLVVVTIFVDLKFVNKFIGFKVKVLTDLGGLSSVQSFLTGIILYISLKHQHTATNKGKEITN